MSRRPGVEGGPPSSGDPADDFVPEEKSRRPKDTPFRQQRVKSFLPILQPVLVVGIFLAIGVVFIPLGKWFIDESKSVVEYVRRYDSVSDGIVGCNITEADEKGNCTIEIDVDKYMSAPIYVYYQLDNYYQNHRRYVKSRSSNQLLGKDVKPEGLCDPLLKTTVDGVELDLNPCGLIANSMFNDIITLTNENITMEESGISWESDREERFKQPPGFVYVENGTDNCSTCEECLGGDEYSDCENYTDVETGKNYMYWYPDNDETHFLYEIYPDIVSPIEGVLNEHFIVWMRTAGLPKFRKVYGRIEQDLSPYDVLTFNITSNFYVSEFSGKKSLVVSNLSRMGARNPYLGIAYIALGSLSLAVGVGFAIKHISDPRKLGDTKFLVWKDTAL